MLRAAANLHKVWGNTLDEGMLVYERGRPHNSSSVRTNSSDNSSPEPRSGKTRGTGKNMMIYTRRTVYNINGKKHRGKWVKAVDPEGLYGGPYANIEDLLHSRKYREKYGPTRSASHNRSRTRRRR